MRFDALAHGFGCGNPKMRSAAGFQPVICLQGIS